MVLFYIYFSFHFQSHKLMWFKAAKINILLIRRKGQRKLISDFFNEC